MPPIPNAGAIVYAALFSTLGIPADALMHAAVLEMVADYVETATTVLLLILRTAREAARLHLLDRQRLLER